jgi:hypothetical protein
MVITINVVVAVVWTFVSVVLRLKCSLICRIVYRFHFDLFRETSQEPNYPSTLDVTMVTVMNTLRLTVKQIKKRPTLL